MVLLWVDFKVPALKVTPLRLNALHPSYWKCLDCFLVVLLRNVPETPAHSNLQVIDISESVSPQICFEARKQKIIGRREVRAIRWVGHHEYCTLSNQCKCRHCRVRRRVVMLQSHFMVAFFIPGPKAWSFPSHSFFELPDDFTIVLSCHCLPRWQEVCEHHSLLVPKHSQHHFLFQAVAQSFLWSLGVSTLGEPLLGFCFQLKLEHWHPALVACDNSG